jgi:hypothetical protein
MTQGSFNVKLGKMSLGIVICFHLMLTNIVNSQSLFFYVVILRQRSNHFIHQALSLFFDYTRIPAESVLPFYVFNIKTSFT